MARIGMLTGGGDCPGLNAVIRAVVRKGTEMHGHEFTGFLRGWAGILEGDTIELDRDAVSGILQRGGTILGSSRTNVYKEDDGEARAIAMLEKLGIDALIPIGGEDTLGVATKLSKAGVKIVGVPKTIDNDLSGTDYTFGFQTAVEIATEAIDRCHSTAESHDRVIVVEVMGRHAGWIAAHSGLAGGADVVLVPERPFDIEQVCERLKARHATGRKFSIVVASEGAMPIGGSEVQSKEVDAFGHARLGGIAAALEKEIESRTGFETRQTTLGHIQRGGTPSAYDRVLATRFGLRAIDAVNDGEFGNMVALHGTKIELVPLSEATDTLKVLDDEFMDTAAVFFG